MTDITAHHDCISQFIMADITAQQKQKQNEKINSKVKKKF